MSDRTLTEARAWLRSRVDEGAHCPCCHQFAKVYRRSISGAMGATLIAMYRLDDTGLQWIHIEQDINDAGLTAKRSRDYAKLRYWDLIEAHPENTDARPGRSSAGLWRITSIGRQYVRGELPIPKYARVYDNRVLGFDGPDVFLEDCLGKEFDYGELMGSAPGAIDESERQAALL